LRQAGVLIFVFIVVVFVSHKSSAFQLRGFDPREFQNATECRFPPSARSISVVDCAKAVEPLLSLSDRVIVGGGKNEAGGIVDHNGKRFADPHSISGNSARVLGGEWRACGKILAARHQQRPQTNLFDYGFSGAGIHKHKFNC
jgi:hypothetical protein